jgi:nucleoside-diphosphate-sugar epimerase
MPILDKLSKHSNVPVAIIFRGANCLGVELSKLLIEQRAYVILIDEYTQRKKQKVSSLINKDLFSFVDISGAKSVADSIKKVDYIFYLNHEDYDPFESVSTSEFLEKSNILDKLLQLATEKKSKFLLTSSIKLHQILQSKRDVSSDFDPDNDGLNYTILEVQRYAENLTWEYHERAGLDARIVRVGEMLGEGIDLERKSVVGEFLKNAISGEKLAIQGDGLENLFFVYVLDAAYGLVKAQFTEKTSGSIYSLVIPRDITILNLAYKIIDLEPRAGGIDFVEKKEKEGLSIYKPAKNLKEIGWKPKVSFERALALTIDYAYTIWGKSKTVRGEKAKQKFIKSKKKRETKKRKSLKDFFVNFFFEVKEEKQPPSVLDSLQYSSYDKRVLDKNVSKGDGKDRVYLSQKKDRSRPKRSRFKVVGWKIMDFVEATKNAIRSLTLAKFITYAIIFTVLLLVYLAFIVPVSKITYHSSIVYIRLNSIPQLIENWEFSEVDENLSKARESLEQVGTNADKLSYLSVVKLDDYIDSLKTKAINLTTLIDASQTVLEGMIPLETYVNTYQSNVGLDGSDNLKVQSSMEYDLNELQDIGRQMSEAAEVFDNTSQIFGDSATSYPIIGNRLDAFNSQLDEIKYNLKAASESIQILPELLGVGDERTYAILLLDKNKINIKGGQILAVCAVTVDDGSVINIKVYSATDIKLELSSQQDRFVRDDLKLLYPEEGLEFQDLTLISSDTTFTSLISSTLASDFGKGIDHVFTLNFEAVRDFVSLTGGIDLEKVGAINSTNFDESIYKEDISHKELLAKILERFLRFKREDVSSFATFASKHLQNQNMVFYIYEDVFINYLMKKDIFINNISEEYDIFNVAMVSDSAQLPQVEVESKIDVESESIEHEYKFDLKNSTDEIFEGIFVVEFGENFSIGETNSLSDKLELASSYQNKAFISINIDDKEEHSFVIKGESDSIVISAESGYNYNLLFKKPSGLEYYYEFILNYDDKLEMTLSPEESIKLNNTIRLEGNIARDLLWRFSFLPLE